MSVRLRLGAMVAKWLAFERKKPLLSHSRLPLRVWLTDCDVNLHMNNSRYLALMDMGRWHLLAVTGLGAEVMRRKWLPVVARIEIDFKRSLNPFERFELETRMESVGTKSVTLVQRFWVGDRLAAEARVIALFVHKGKSQELAPLIAACPHTLQSPSVVTEEPAPQPVEVTA